MKKNIKRVISLVIVASMLFAFCSCTQTVLVRFVDKDGNDINIGALTGGNAVAPVETSAEAPSDTSGDAPSDLPTEENPASGETQAEAPSSESNNSSEPSSESASETPVTQAPSSSSAASTVPTGKEAVFNFYKTAASKVKNDGAAGYTKKEWQTISSLNLTGISLVDNAIASIAGNYMTKEADAESQVAAKGSKEAKDRFPACKLTDLSKVKSATCTVQSNGNYKITIIMVDEDTPKKTGSFLGQVTNSILYWEDIEAELNKIDQIKEFSNIHVIYKGYKIEAEITPAGNFVSLKHLGSVDIEIGHAKVLIASLDNKSGHLDNYCVYSDFKY